MDCAKCSAPQEVGKLCKPCKSARAKEYYRKNSDHIKEKSRINAAAERLAKPEYFLARASARTKKYREMNPEKARKSVAAHRSANPDWNDQTPEQKERAIARTAKYKSENLEFVSAQRCAISARYRAKSPEKAKASVARYRAANPDWNKAATPSKERVRGAKYRAANSQACNERTAKCRAMNPDQGRLYGKKWRAENRDKKNAAWRRYRARKLDAEGTHSHTEWLAKKAEYGFCCIDCGLKEGDTFQSNAAPRYAGKPMELTVGHAVPLEPRTGSGNPRGTDYIDNIIPQCGPCNSKQGNYYIHPLAIDSSRRS